MLAIYLKDGYQDLKDLYDSYDILRLAFVHGSLRMGEYNYRLLIDSDIIKEIVQERIVVSGRSMPGTHIPSFSFYGYELCKLLFNRTAGVHGTTNKIFRKGIVI